IRVNDALGLDLHVRDVFEASTPSSLARVVGDCVRVSRTLPLAPRTPSAPVPLTAAQHRMWYANDAGPSSLWNMTFTWHVIGTAPDLLCAAVVDVVAAFDILRTTFPVQKGSPVQHVADVSESGFEVARRNVGWNDIAGVMKEFVDRPFDLRSQLPFRAAVFTVPDQTLFFGLSVNHVAVDAVGLKLLMQEICRAYARQLLGEGPRKPDDIQFADYAVWQDTLRGDPTDSDSPLNQRLRYWERTLRGRAHPLDIVGRGVPSVSRSWHGRTLPVRIDSATHALLRDAAKFQKTTLFIAVQTAFAVFVSTLSESNDVTVACGSAERETAGLEDMLGNFAIDVPLRIVIQQSATYADLLAAMNRIALSAFENKDVSEFELKQHLERSRTPLPPGPLFQAMLVMREYQRSDASIRLQLPGAEVEQYSFGTDVGQHDVEFSLVALVDEDGTPCGIEGYFITPEWMFTETEARFLADQFVDLIDRLARNPDRIPERFDVKDLKK
ncbi:condensation domain-containing protein, partial [Nocardia sp. R7R-8]|uniref:condensation domain-containing protein n=1 Tax=Nocardia sp. R7R-8 TaxID=3459304 RepID=UPI00403DDC1F